MADPFARYDQWLQSGDPGQSGADYAEGYPVKCSYCGDRIYAPKAEDMWGVPHEECVDVDTGLPGGIYFTDEDWDWRDEDPRIP